jgi:predicted nucleotidyltransferase
MAGLKLLSKNTAGILNLFRRDILMEKTIRELAKMLGKSYPKIHKAAKEMERNGVLAVKKVGNASICRVNFSPKTISLLSFLDEQESFSKDIPNMEKILEFSEFLDDIVLVAGSYAKGRQTPKSDIDLVVITKSNAIKKQKLIENMTSLLLPLMHPIVITQKDFIIMLLEKKQNYGKEIFKNRLLFRNAERYYLLIKEAWENGFRG